MESFSFGAYSPLGAPKFKLPGATIKKENYLRKTLNGIKHLYFERRYRQCATTCEELLSGKCREVCSSSDELPSLSTDAFDIRPFL